MSCAMLMLPYCSLTFALQVCLCTDASHRSHCMLGHRTSYSTSIWDTSPGSIQGTKRRHVRRPRCAKRQLGHQLPIGMRMHACSRLVRQKWAKSSHLAVAGRRWRRLRALIYDGASIIQQQEDCDRAGRTTAHDVGASEAACRAERA